MVIKTVNHFVDSKLGVEISSKKEGLTEKRVEFWKLLCQGGRQITYLGKGRVSLGDQGLGETIQINYKMNFIQDSCERFSLQFKSTFH